MTGISPSADQPGSASRVPSSSRRNPASDPARRVANALGGGRKRIGEPVNLVKFSQCRLPGRGLALRSKHDHRPLRRPKPRPPSTLDSSSGFTEAPLVSTIGTRLVSASETIKKPAEPPLPGIRTPFLSQHSQPLQAGGLWSPPRRIPLPASSSLAPRLRFTRLGGPVAPGSTPLLPCTR